MDPSSEAPHIDTSVGDMPSPSDYSEGMVDSPTMAEMGDSLKLFVGQIPKTMDEDVLRPFFSQFGALSDITIIRDKVTDAHKGCAFVTYLSRGDAVNAINNLHDRVKLESSPNFLQIRPADYPTEREHKVFVGMLHKGYAETDLERMFGVYGELKEVHIIRDRDGSSKGCAFIKFVDRNAAVLAIQELNDSVPNGCTRPLVLKFADTKKQKTAAAIAGSGPGKKVDSTAPMERYWVDSAAPYAYHPSYVHPSVPVAGIRAASGAPGSLSSRGPTSSGAPTRVVQIPIAPSPFGVAYSPPHIIAPHSPPAQHPGAAGGYYYYADPGSPHVSYYGAMGGRVPASAAIAGRLDPRSRDAARSFDGYGELENEVSVVEGSSRPPEGPPGANLFIYHLPRDLTDADLATLFAAFGNVVSAKVFVDKKTAESKGFGFVSYDNVSSADAAIAAMNGFQIGSKRLKVQHKRMGGELEGNGPSVRMTAEFAADPRGPPPMHHHAGSLYGAGPLESAAPMKVMYYHSSSVQQQRSLQPGTLAYHVGLSQL